MLGNLSKVLFKAPSIFNNNINNNNIESINNMKEVKTLSTFNSKNNYNINNLYFREKDFWKKNYEPEINFNHNKRLSFYLNISPKKQQSLKIESLNKKIRFKTINKKIRNSYVLTDSPIINKGNKSNIFSIYKNNNSIYQNNTITSDRRLNTESDRIIKEKNNLKLFNNNIFKHIKINNNAYENYKFPNIVKTFKSQETLFQDNADNKLSSLILIKPEIKEQLKTKNRCMVGKKDFLRYLNFRKNIYQNPFYESMKIKEDMNNFLK